VTDDRARGRGGRDGADAATAALARLLPRLTVAKSRDYAPRMAGPPKDWMAILERLEHGDRLAFLEMNRLVTGCLTQLRAYDFQDEWDDLRQEVVLAVLANARAGRLRDPQAFVGYVRIVTRNKLMDRLKRRLDHHEKDSLPWDDATAAAAVADVAADADAQVDASALRAALDELPADERRVVDGIYAQGQTYEEVAAATGIPLGTMKRRLRDAMVFLRRRLATG
jgi:RNA polymerase sigma factor (sigma-70 family)